MANLISLYGANKVNGIYIAGTTFLQDCPAAQIVSVMNCNFDNEDGNTVPGFWIRVQNPMGLTIEDVYMQTHTGLTTIANFASGLTAVNSGNTFTTYTDLKRGSDIAEGLVPANTSLLLNDVWTQNRTFVPDEDETVINVTGKNRLSYTQYVVDGDQTYAGQYQYFTSSGNV